MNIRNTMIFILALGFLSANYSQKAILSKNIKKNTTNINKEETILARIGDKVITVPEFYERAEYTIRPQYAKGNSEIDKKIVLNSLIAEKLLTIERGKNSQLRDQEKFQATIQGRKEQMMRKMLFYKEGFDKASYDSSEFTRNYKLSGRTYTVEFINVSDSGESRHFENKLIEEKWSFKQLYKQVTGDTIVPKYQVTWNSPEYPEISDILFNYDSVNTNKVYGPIKLPETTLFFKVSGWTDRPAITENDQRQRFSNVSEKLLMDKGEKKYSEFIQKVMLGKKIEFNKDTFRKVAKIFAEIYNQDPKDIQQNFINKNLKNEIDLNNKIAENEIKIEELKAEPFFTLDGKTWTVEMFEKERAKHPLVFRKKRFSGKEFPKNFRDAVIDLMRDTYLTAEAYKNGFDKTPVVKRTETMWSDALVSFYEQTQILKEKNINDFLTYEVVKDVFTPYMNELKKKYSNQIYINIEEYKKLKLTRIDFFAVERNAPFPIIAPAFPNITTDHNLDYGKKMIINK